MGAPSAIATSAPIALRSGVTWSEPEALTEASASLRGALKDVTRGVDNAESALETILVDDCTWSMPLTDATDRVGVAEMLDGFFGFVLEAVLLFTAEVVAEGGVKLTWLFSFTYPLPWRPRVTISGESLVSVTEDRVVGVVDSWDAGMGSVIRQVMPRWADIVWLYPSPHAEVDVGTRKLLKKESGYQIVRVAARPEIIVEGLYAEKESNFVTAVPALPFGSFIGGLRRKEDYATVSPVSVRRLEKCDEVQRFEFSVAVPGSMFDEGGRATPLPSHPSPDVRVAMTPARRCAVVRYSGYAIAEVFDKQVAMLVTKLQNDGFLPKEEEIDMRKVWARSYDSKIGFNGSSEMAIGTCGGGVLFGVPPRWNELLIELPDDEGADGRN